MNAEKYGKTVKKRFLCKTEIYEMWDLKKYIKKIPKYTEEYLKYTKKNQNDVDNLR